MKKLIPPDLEQCQCKILEGSFMTFGKPTYHRCENMPTVVVYENEQGDDGQKGSMSLCDKCLKVMIEKYGEEFATVKPIIKVS